METTDILSNPAALHSLKRAQLVQLCKLHKIKASGKNSELISRLKRHANNLPPDTPLKAAGRGESSDCGDIAAESEGVTEDESDGDFSPITNWTIVMPSIPEEEHNGHGSIESKTTLGISSQNGGDFGTSGSSRSTLMKSFVNSIGLKRNTSGTSNTETLTNTESVDSLDLTKRIGSLKSGPSGSKKPLTSLFSGNNNTNTRDSLAKHAVPYKDIPQSSQLPKTDSIEFTDYHGLADMSVDSMDIPVPGIGGRVGVGMDSMALGSTIRLITSTGSSMPNNDDDLPNLEPITPGFDLIPPTPGRPAITKWPASPEKKEVEGERLYPTLEPEDLDVYLDTNPSESKLTREPLSPLPDAAPKDAFVFGSPNPRHSSSAGDFSKVASSVLAEMNARLGALGGRTVDTNLLKNAPRSELSTEELMSYQFGGSRPLDGTTKKDDSLSSRFNEKHEKAFARMPGIDTHYAAKRGTKESSGTNDKKRKSIVFDKGADVVGKNQPVPVKKQKTSATAGNSPETKMKPVVEDSVPGAYVVGEEEGEEKEQTEEGLSSDDAEKESKERGAKRACIEKTETGTGVTKRISIAPAALKKESNAGEDKDEEKRKRQKEAINRHLALAKARRRSSRGVPSTAGGRASVAAQQKKSGFGLLTTAKSFVKSVWNRGSGNPVNKPASKDTKPSTSTVAPSVTATKSVTSAPGQSGIAPKTVARGLLGVKPSVSRVSTNRNPGSGAIRTGGTLRPKVKTNLTPVDPQRAVSSTSKKDSPVTPNPVPPTSNSAKSGTGPILGSTRARKPPTTLAGPSRLTAPTASSLAKMNTNPVTKAGAKTNTSTKVVTPKVNRVRVPAAILSPSKLPVVPPLLKKRANQSVAPGTKAKDSIFSSPLVLPKSPQAQAAEEKGDVINPITGAILPYPSSSEGDAAAVLIGLVCPTKVPGEDSPVETQSEAKEDGGNVKASVSEGKKPADKPTFARRQSALPRPTFRTELKLKRPHISSPRKPLTSGPSYMNHGGVATTDDKGSANIRLASPKYKVRSSMRVSGKSVAVRGGNEADDVLMSAKKRVRTSEYQRRKKNGPNFGSPKSGREMDVDD